MKVIGLLCRLAPLLCIWHLRVGFPGGSETSDDPSESRRLVREWPTNDKCLPVVASTYASETFRESWMGYSQEYAVGIALSP
jgi:hypothetical protein